MQDDASGSISDIARLVVNEMEQNSPLNVPDELDRTSDSETKESRDEENSDHESSDSSPGM